MNFVWSFLLGFLGRVFAGITGEVVSGIIDIARGVVASLENEDISGKEKFEKACDLVKKEAEEHGVKTATHAINLAVEMAVAELRK